MASRLLAKKPRLSRSALRKWPEPLPFHPRTYCSSEVEPRSRRTNKEEISRLVPLGAGKTSLHSEPIAEGRGSLLFAKPKRQSRLGESLAVAPDSMSAKIPYLG